MRSRQVKGTQLRDFDQRYVLGAYVHRMTHENIKRHPEYARMMFAHGYRLPIISDATWLGVTLFWVRKDGRLDYRYKRCETRQP